VLSLAFTDERITGPVTPERIAAATHGGTRDRLAGYHEALSEAGIDTSTVPVFETQNDKAGTLAGLEHFFAADEPPTAILAMSDKVALHALDWFREHGIAVPREVSIIGFDGVPDGVFSEPQLTTVAQPMVELGRRAAQRILDFDGTIRRELLPVELVVRGSTARPDSPV
jgi:DNA-binding LacI/PurR family transcriptional regulator